MRHLRFAGIALGLCLGACDPGGGGRTGGDAAGENEAAGAAAADAAGGGEARLPPCPFRRTAGWNGSIEAGRLNVTGRVDLQMAGMKPVLSERPGAPAGTIAFDLALVPEAGAAVTEQVRYQKSGARPSRRGEIWCGGERIADFDMILID